MNASSSVNIAFRIPGLWSHPKELVEQLPAGYRLTPDAFVLPDGTSLAFGAGQADRQFPDIFRASLREAASPNELVRVANYRVNVFLMGPGGSLAAARTMMQAAAAVVQAGGAGVFIDNSGLAHGGQSWLTLTEDGSSDAVSFAFVSIIRGKADVWTVGMHALGLRDIVMKRTDMEERGFDIVDVLRYLASGDKPVEAGHIIMDQSGPRFRASLDESSDMPTGSPMHNPFGRLRLVSVADIAETN